MKTKAISHKFTLTGMPIVKHAGMVGSKVAIQIDETIFVSPAMWALMTDATPEELEHLFKHLDVLNLSAYRTIGSVPLEYMK